MRHINFVRRATSLGVAAASSLFGFLLFAPSAFALVVKPVGGDGSSSAVTRPIAPSTGHSIVAGGMAG